MVSANTETTENGAFFLERGGDSVAAVDQFGLAEKISCLRSDPYWTGGGGMLEYWEGKVCRGSRRYRSEL